MVNTCRKLNELIVVNNDRFYLSAIGSPGLVSIPRREGKSRMASLERGWTDPPGRVFLEQIAKVDEQVCDQQLHSQGLLALRAAQRMHARRGVIRYDFGQGPCIPSTSVRRAALFADRHRGGRLLLFGDDDLVAPIATMFGMTVTVLDIDEQLIRFLGSQQKAEGFSLEFVKHDLFSTKSISPLGSRTFDAIAFDPFSERRWFDAWLDVGKRYLSDDGRIYLSVYRGAEKIGQESAAGAGLAVREVHTGFSKYFDHHLNYMPDYDSSLFVLAKGGPRSRQNLSHARATPTKTVFEFTSDFGLRRFRALDSARFSELVGDIGKILGVKMPEIATTLDAGLLTASFNVSPWRVAVQARRDWLGLSVLVSGEDGYPLLEIEELVTSSIRPVWIRHGERRRSA